MKLLLLLALFGIYYMLYIYIYVLRFPHIPPPDLFRINPRHRRRSLRHCEYGRIRQRRGTHPGALPTPSHHDTTPPPPAPAGIAAVPSTVQQALPPRRRPRRPAGPTPCRSSPPAATASAAPGSARKSGFLGRRETPR